ncbi:hypothetical protein MRX96_029023 [Rhipicephalus microplus]
MAAAMNFDGFPTLGTAPVTGQTQMRKTTLRPAKRLKPSDAKEWSEPLVIPEKMPASAITVPQVHLAGSKADVQTPVSMRSDESLEEEGSHAEPIQTTAAELEGRRLQPGREA